jgi:hypothetical protein
MANPIAVPGTPVPSGAAVSPGGAQGVTGTSAWTTNTAGFTIPAVGSTVSVTVADASWIVVGEMLYVDQAGGGVGLSGVLQVTAKAGNTLTLLNPQPAPVIPLADATQPGLLKQLSGNTAQFVDGTNTCRTPPAATATVTGYVPTPPNDATKYLAGNATFAQPSLNNLTSTAWTPLTITVVPGAGAITAQTSDSSYLRMGKTMFLNMKVTISNIGTASGSTTLAGFPAALKRDVVGYLRENAVNGLGYSWLCSANGTSGYVQKYDNTNPAWANGISYAGFLVYETI